MTYADLFAQSRAEPIDVDGTRVLARYDLTDLPRTVLAVRMTVRAPRDQALCLAGLGGKLEVDGQVAPNMVLWSDVAPPITEVRTRPGRAGVMAVRLWNAWRGTRGVLHAGIGNFGMLVEESDDGWVLSCSDGWGEPSFGDAIFRVSRRDD